MKPIHLTQVKTSFEECYDLRGQTERITTHQAFHLPIGSVALVRSDNVTELGDHFIIITGHAVMKQHGLRPQTFQMATTEHSILNRYKTEMGVTILKLKEPARQAWLKFHQIKMENGKVILP